MPNTRLELNRLYAWCRENNITFDMVKAGGGSTGFIVNVWLYQNNNKLLRTFLVDNDTISFIDFTNWCNTLGFSLP
jgi:hypothetical protein